MTDPIITPQQLALWSQQDPETVAADPWALEVIQVFSDYARFLAGRDGTQTDSTGATVEAWTASTAPYDVKLAVLMASRRTYTNPDSETSSTTGPISSTILTEAALAGAFTDTELATIKGYNVGGDPSGLWVLHTTRGDDPVPVDEVLYVSDDQQVGLADSADPREWKIPLFNPLDPGSPALYEES